MPPWSVVVYPIRPEQLKEEDSHHIEVRHGAEHNRVCVCGDVHEECNKYMAAGEGGGPSGASAADGVGRAGGLLEPSRHGFGLAHDADGVQAQHLLDLLVRVPSAHDTHDTHETYDTQTFM
jgi:hypothetical protein